MHMGDCMYFSNLKAFFTAVLYGVFQDWHFFRDFWHFSRSRFLAIFSIFKVKILRFFNFSKEFLC